MDKGYSNKKIRIISFTAAGEALSESLRGFFSEEGYEAESASGVGKGRLKAWTEEHFKKDNVLIFIGSCGIAVRSIAPHLRSKTTDPAVIVVDEKGRFVIPILSGHIGAANDFSKRIADFTRGEAVLTTATDVNKLLAVDSFAAKNGMHIIDMEKAKDFAASILREGEAFFVLPSEYREDIVFKELPERVRVEYFEGALGAEFLRGGDCQSIGEIAKETSADLETEHGEAGQKGVNEAHKNAVCAGIHRKGQDPSLNLVNEAGKTTVCAGESLSGRKAVCLISPEIYRAEYLQLVPKCVVLGVGCRKGKPAEDIYNYILSLLEKHRLSIHSLCRITSVDVKAKEAGIISAAERLGIPFVTYSAEELNKVEGGFTASQFVKSRIGVDNVCERSVICSGAKRLLFKKEAQDGITLAAGIVYTELR